MLKFKVISPFEIYEELGEVIDRNHLYKYDVERPGILENVDVFCPNSRSDSQEYTRFDLFEQVENEYNYILSELQAYNRCVNYIEVKENFKKLVN